MKSKEEIDSFLSQFLKAKEELDKWPDWMKSSAVEATASFPKLQYAKDYGEQLHPPYIDNNRYQLSGIDYKDLKDAIYQVTQTNKYRHEPEVLDNAIDILRKISIRTLGLF